VTKHCRQSVSVKRYLYTYPKNKVILFFRKRRVRVRVKVKVRVTVEVRVNGNRFNKYVFGQTSIRVRVLDPFVTPLSIFVVSHLFSFTTPRLFYITSNVFLQFLKFPIIKSYGLNGIRWHHNATRLLGLSYQFSN